MFRSENRQCNEEVKVHREPNLRKNRSISNRDIGHCPDSDLESSYNLALEPTKDVIERVGKKIVRYIMNSRNDGIFEISLLYYYEANSEFREQITEEFASRCEIRK